VKGEGILETLEDLKSFDLQMFQPRQGYRYSLDAILLTQFCAALKAESIIDLGAGCGIVSLVLARINCEASVVAFENNPEMAALVQRNILHNDLAGRVSVHDEDVINLRRSFSDSTFDLVVSNPPFRTSVSGKVSPMAGRDSARHETTAGLADFLAAAKYLVKPSGRICFIHHPSRLSEFVTTAGELKLAITRLRFVHGTSLLPATMFLTELAKGSRRSPAVESPLIVRDDRGNYSEEVAEMLGVYHKKTSEVSKTSEWSSSSRPYKH
jgi:tRNA1Val (adenine37-N6)-methyltransferase